MNDLTISYDYELCWGVWDTLPTAYAESHVRRANECAKALCVLHERFSLPATWAIVGAAIDLDVSVGDRFASSDYSVVEREQFDAYVATVGAKAELFDIPDDILGEIRRKNLFEFGCHTYAHRYANKISSEAFAKDLNRFRDVSDSSCSSLVLPRNIVSEPALSLAGLAGFTVVRVNPGNALYLAVKGKGFRSFLIRALRYVDAFIPLQEVLPSRQSYFCPPDLRLTEGQYFFRPDCGNAFLDNLHRFRLMLGISICRYKGVGAHLWSHPHNFGADPSTSLSNAEKLFSCLSAAVQSGKSSVKLMSDLAPSCSERVPAKSSQDISA